MIAKALAQETPVIFLDERLLFLISPVSGDYATASSFVTFYQQDDFSFYP